jgi:carbonic anhydrase
LPISRRPSAPTPLSLGAATRACELFIVRVAGNVMSPEVMGSIQYAAVHLQTPLFVVMGHAGCGAVEAALNTHASARASRGSSSGFCRACRGIDTTLPAKAKMRAAVEANVRWSMQQVLDTPEARARQAEGVLKLVGAVYELTTGRVRFLP